MSEDTTSTLNKNPDSWGSGRVMPPEIHIIRSVDGLKDLRPGSIVEIPVSDVLTLRQMHNLIMAAHETSDPSIRKAALAVLDRALTPPPMMMAPKTE